MNDGSNLERKPKLIKASKKSGIEEIKADTGQDIKPETEKELTEREKLELQAKKLTTEWKIESGHIEGRPFEIPEKRSGRRY